jgi:lipopolysaccharide/colanic/teichoic acid biosynthesis glycosyltransferase
MYRSIVEGNMIGTLKLTEEGRDVKSGSNRDSARAERFVAGPVESVVIRLETVHPGRDWTVGLPGGWYIALREAVEFAAALVLLVASAPFILLGAILIKLTSPGPVIYSQTRLGRLGRPYEIYKLRTMTHNCESATGPLWSTKGDPRVTRIGRLLRASHLDELPQLWNVLRGEMGLLGPRPERPEFAAQLENAIPRYWERMLLRPGITGLAQVQLPADTDLESVRRKLAYDLYHIWQPNFWLDCRIILCTALKMVGAPFWLLSRLFRMPTEDVVQAALRTSANRAAQGVPQVQPA